MEAKLEEAEAAVDALDAALVQAGADVEEAVRLSREREAAAARVEALWEDLERLTELIS